VIFSFLRRLSRSWKKTATVISVRDFDNAGDDDDNNNNNNNNSNPCSEGGTNYKDLESANILT
jgi:hypothetical protein